MLSSRFDGLLVLTSILSLPGLQIYRGNTFGNLFSEYAEFQKRAPTRKPLLITEFGVDALDFRIADGIK